MPKSNLSGTQEATTDQLKNLDVQILIDHSGSMGEPSTRFAGKTKYEELREDVGAISREMAKFDDDGLTLITFSSSARVTDGVKPDDVARVFSEHGPRGSTNLAAALQLAVDKATASSKPNVVLVFTDGSPDDQKAAADVVEAAGKKLGRPRIGFAFIQVGNDGGAAAFLDHLDNELSVDVTATIRAADAEGLSCPQIVWLAQNA
jgi:uncharacterized protein YegL